MDCETLEQGRYGITFTGRRFSEEKLISCAYAFEQATLAVKGVDEKLLTKPSH
jgi:Asp-tRNA(Asn)/Glu-tRNA(Gln) amidotransferase A subunit family amidase